MNLLVISDNYPCDRMPNKGAFVYNLVQALSRHHKITVVAPFKAHDLLKPWQKGGYGEERAKVYRPVYLSLSNKTFMGINTGLWSRYLKAKSVNKCLDRLPFRADVIYAHFLSNAYSALSYVMENSTPLVIASGESSYSGFAAFPKDELRNLIHFTSHIICVSQANMISLKSLGFDDRKMTVVPNAVDYETFKPMNKTSCKEQLNIPVKNFVVGFVGHFIHRKGPNRVIEAIKLLNDEEVSFVCVGGNGNLLPNDFTKIVPPVPNYQLPEIYNAFDVFVLPTLNEGHCNVIEEAKACGIPIISSQGTSVEEQVDESSGILIDPMNIRAIADAILLIKENKGVRERLYQNLLGQRGQKSLDDRAAKISDIIQSAASQVE